MTSTQGVQKMSIFFNKKETVLQKGDRKMILGMACGKINAVSMWENSFSHLQRMCHSQNYLVISLTTSI